VNNIPIPQATFSYQVDESNLEAKLEETIYRITNELATNALKHSGAKQIQVEIIRFGDIITLTVQDNDNNFNPEVLPKAWD